MSFGDIEKMFSGKAIADFVAKIYTILEVSGTNNLEKVVQQDHLLELRWQVDPDKEHSKVVGGGIAEFLPSCQAGIIHPTAEHVWLQ